VSKEAQIERDKGEGMSHENAQLWCIVYKCFLPATIEDLEGESVVM
jgi:hypothetical protein